MAAVFDIGTMITSKPGIHGGRPIIAGTGVTVRRIAGWYRLGYGPEEIVRKIDHLSLAQVHAALAYDHANQEAIDAELDEEAAEYDRLAREHYSLWSAATCHRTPRYTEREQRTWRK